MPPLFADTSEDLKTAAKVQSSSAFKSSADAKGEITAGTFEADAESCAAEVTACEVSEDVLSGPAAKVSAEDAADTAAEASVFEAGEAAAPAPVLPQEASSRQPAHIKTGKANGFLFNFSPSVQTL